MLDLNETGIANDDGTAEEQNDYGITDHVTESVECVFKQIAARLTLEIDRHQYAVGCVAWMKHWGILNALARMKGVAIVVQKEDFLRPDHGGPSDAQTRALYEAIPGMSRRDLPLLRWMNSCSDPAIEAVRCCGVFDERNRNWKPNCHHKFLVFGDLAAGGTEQTGRFRPKAVWTGSFNFTMNAGRSFENAVIIRSRKIATAYLNEFAQVAALSEPLDWTAKYVAPEWRLGT